MRLNLNRCHIGHYNYSYYHFNNNDSVFDLISNYYSSDDYISNFNIVFEHNNDRRQFEQCLSITVNGPQCDSTINAGDVNDPCVTVTVCTPNTSACQTVNSILLDTGSYGLRIFKQKLNNVSFAEVAAGSGSLAECAQFGDGSTLWGPVQTAGVVLGNEPVVQVPISGNRLNVRHYPPHVRNAIYYSI